MPLEIRGDARLTSAIECPKAVGCEGLPMDSRTFGCAKSVANELPNSTVKRRRSMMERSMFATWQCEACRQGARLLEDALGRDGGRR